MSRFRGAAGATAGLVAWATLAFPPVATADGGAYIDMDRTHYLIGGTAEGVGYVSIPERHRDLLQHGPFYVYVVPERTWVVEGRPTPDGAIRVGTASIVPEGGRTFAVRIAFTVPRVPGAYYNVQICNDPCTVAGFREPLSAYISIVATHREAELLNELDRAARRTWSVQRRARQVTKASEELQTQLEQSRRDVVALQNEIGRLEHASTTSGTPVTSVAPSLDARPLVDAWALFGIAIALIVAALSLGLAITFSRRSATRIVVPDTIAELDREDAFVSG